jgi:uncharacterized protein (DUF2062 family)
MKLLSKYKPLISLVDTIKDLVFTGNSPHKLSLAVTLGLLFGVFPFLGVTTILLAIISLVFRLNMVVIQISNYVAYPVQLLLYLPFLKAGKYLGNMHEITVSNVFSIMKDNWVDGIGRLWQIHLWAIFAWFLISVPTGYLLYLFLKSWIKRLKPKIEKNIKIHIQD